MLTKWKSRFFSLVIPYCIWNIAAYLFYQIIAAIPSLLNNVNWEIEPFNAIWLIKNMIFGYHNITWFIRYLIVYVIVFPLLYPIINKKIRCVIVLFLLFILGGILSNHYISYSVVFGCGAFIGMFYKKIPMRKTPNCLLPLLGFLTIVLVDTCFVIPTVLYFPIRIIQAILIWLSADRLAVECEVKWYMKISFFIYCTHSMILETIEKIILIIFGKATIWAVFGFVMAPILTLFVIYVAAALLRKTGKIWCIINGGR